MQLKQFLTLLFAVCLGKVSTAQDVIEFQTINGRCFLDKVVATPDGGKYLAGLADGIYDIQGVTHNTEDYIIGVLVRYNADNSIAWIQEAVSESMAYFTDIYLDKQNGITVVGSFHDHLHIAGVDLYKDPYGTGPDGFIASFTIDGTLRFVQHIAAAGYTDFHTVSVDKTGKKYVAATMSDAFMFNGLTYPITGPEQQAKLLVYDRHGNEDTVIAFASSVISFLYYVETDKWNNVVVVGNFQNDITIDGELFSVPGYGMFAVKLNQAGDVLWKQVMETNNQTYASAVTLDPQGNLYMGIRLGSITLNGIIYTDETVSEYEGEGLVVRLSKLTGELMWAQKIATSENVWMNGLHAATDGSVLVVGEYYTDLSCDGTGVNSAASISESFILKLERNGTVISLQHPGAPEANDTYTGVYVMNTGELFVTGRAYGPFTLDEYYIDMESYDGSYWAKIAAGTYKTPAIVEETQVQVYPNPANDVLTINLQGSFERSVISVYTITGQLMQQFYPDEAVVSVSVADLEPGTYVVRIDEHAEVFQVIH